MKKILLMSLLALTACAAHPQSAKPAEPATAKPSAMKRVEQAAATQPVLTERQTDKIQLAIKDYQLAQMTATQAQDAVSKSQQAVLAAVERAKKELGLGDDWDFNFQTLAFFKKPVPEPAAPAKK